MMAYLRSPEPFPVLAYGTVIRADEPDGGDPSASLLPGTIFSDVLWRNVDVVEK